MALSHFQCKKQAAFRVCLVMSIFRFFALILPAGVLIWAIVALADSSALWNIVHGQCVPHAQNGTGPAPCLEIEMTRGEADGYSVLKDRVGIAQHLLIPTWRSPGIEDPRLLDADAPDLWQQAWQARHFVEQALGRPLSDRSFGMAINSADARSQDQLHIHLDCLADAAGSILPDFLSLRTDSWRDVAATLPGGPYRGLRIEAENLAGVSPFRLLGASLTNPADMAHQSLAVLSYRPDGGKRSFILLASRHFLLLGERGHAEDLLDHNCRAALRDQ